MFIYSLNISLFFENEMFFFLLYEIHFKFENVHKSSVFTLDQLLEIQCLVVRNGTVFVPYFLLYSFNPVYCDHLSLAVLFSLSKSLSFI